MSAHGPGGHPCNTLAPPAAWCAVPVAPWPAGPPTLLSTLAGMAPTSLPAQVSARGQLLLPQRGAKDVSSGEAAGQE